MTKSQKTWALHLENDFVSMDCDGYEVFKLVFPLGRCSEMWSNRVMDKIQMQNLPAGIAKYRMLPGEFTILADYILVIHSPAISPKIRTKRKLYTPNTIP